MTNRELDSAILSTIEVEPRTQHAVAFCIGMTGHCRHQRADFRVNYLRRQTSKVRAVVVSFYDRAYYVKLAVR